MGNEVASVKNTSVAAGAYDYGDMAGNGFEDVSVADLSLPYLVVMQPMSPDVVEGTFRPGDLVNSVTKEKINQPVVLQPIYRECYWDEWWPRNSGKKGRVAQHKPDSDVVRQVIAQNGGSKIPPKGSDGKRISFKMPGGQGTELVETYYIYFAVMTDDGLEQIGWLVAAFSSTKVKVYNRLVSVMMTQRGRPPMYAFRVKATTVKETSDGGTYFNLEFKPLGETWAECLLDPRNIGHMEMMQNAREFAGMIASGKAKADHGSVDAMAGGGDAGGSSSSRGGSFASGAASDDDIPF